MTDSPTNATLWGSERTTLEGEVRRVVFVNEESAWGVARFQPPVGAAITVVGRLFGIRPGERLRLTGAWEEDPKYGRQFRVETYLPIAPDTLRGVERYLGSGLVPGIGKVMARRLVAAFGLETLDVIEHQPERLSQVDGIGPVRSRRIQEAWIERRAVREVMLFLQSLGLPGTLAGRVFRRLGQAAISAIKEDPYRLAEEISGIGFDTADRIASNMGVTADSPQRIAAGLLYSLRRAADRGHLFLPRDRAVASTAESLEVPAAAVRDAAARLVEEQSLVAEPAGGGDDVALYLPALHQAEAVTAARVSQLLARPVGGPPIAADRAVEWFEARRRLRLAGAQRRAVGLALTEKMLIITGGPGTGKTTLVRAVVEIANRKSLRLALAAPTGRAAKRLAEATGAEAKTLHRLLEFEPRSARFTRHRGRPLKADLIVVDETSMLDNPLARHLLDAVPDSARLVLVGDVDQLPSVGPGKVLAELIRCRRVPVVRLDRVFRQAEASRIVVNAHRVLRGRLPLTDRTGPDFFFIERREPEQILATLLHLVAERVPRGFGVDGASEIQVLSPMRRGLLGADNLNRELKALLNPGPDRAVGDLAVGDRVMQIRNNYDLEVFNGDIGRLARIDSDRQRLSVLFDDRQVEYEAGEADQLALAYASSVHKAQGSEYPCVVMPIHGQHTVMLQRNLLYTAITRARRVMVLVGERRALYRAVRNDREQRRYTALAGRIRSAS